MNSFPTDDICRGAPAAGGAPELGTVHAVRLEVSGRGDAMSGPAAMLPCRCVADNGIGWPARAAPTGEEIAPMPMICSISELAVAARESRHHCGKPVLKGPSRSRDVRRGM
jgi:hypothetical protein